MAQVPVVRVEDNRKGIIAAIAFLLITFFLLFFIKYSEPDPPKVTIPIPIAMEDSGISNFEINNGGGGSPSPTVNPNPATENPKEQPTQEKSEVQTVTGTGSSNSNTTPSEPAEAANPFSGNGTGGSGTSGSGTGFGSDTGPGSGSGEAGTGAAGDRVRISNIRSKPKTPNDEVCRISLKLTVNSQGTVLRADVIRNQTTATNQRLIDEVIGFAKKEVRYKEKPGARDEITYYTVTVQPG
ncbi:hypothetical protein ERX46_14970 [Brumimicrobium glaciale]|uniref:Energy transducer TonB n=1 Tax=Brumimicrobium glaciale TaxID=200475 RepID=A0A4Q4KHA2_9FLAO|nr:hypothetical protein [Brumimicrobium glaciale]RYM32571.1 hypothetical protein ERX46_14970 [Brumimicrobium glaciale]